MSAETVSIVAIVAGLVSTLLGARAGLLGALKVQDRQIGEKERTRFHDLRLETYAAFFDVTGRNRAIASAGDRIPKEARSEVVRTFGLIALIADTDVSNAAGRVQESIANLENTDTGLVGHMEANRMYIEAATEFRDAARAELGIHGSTALADRTA